MFQYLYGPLACAFGARGGIYCMQFLLCAWRQGYTCLFSLMFVKFSKSKSMKQHRIAVASYLSFGQCSAAYTVQCTADIPMTTAVAAVFCLLL